MQNIISIENQSLDFYLIKQNKFKNLVKNVQHALKTKIYKKEGFSLEDYVKMKWNISKAQAYRFMISAKVIDQLKEFQIQPSYERLCRSLSTYAKTPEQMKLLWSTILKKTHNRPESINSFYVGKVWKELCKDQRYRHICHYEDEIMSKIEESFNNYTKCKKLRQINEKNIPLTISIPSSSIPYEYQQHHHPAYNSPVLSDMENEIYNYNDSVVPVAINTHCVPLTQSSSSISYEYHHHNPAVYNSPVLSDKENDIYNGNGSSGLSIITNKNLDPIVTYTTIPNEPLLINSPIVISPAEKTEITTYPVLNELKTTTNYYIPTTTTPTTFQNVYYSNNVSHPIINNAIYILSSTTS
ncbi:hypothetical protein BCR36DRAFT_372303 [Piromyces finnis]|uniref:Uncharacterized protein n=1 Tax=Piromyces finnis TaxID=1754191 RepID=A0A1Y1V2W6_9FUNG|nr:hypothetical protein BCR36DRAFT_372303 [Piromyces finnis]|eukprot:ORX46141.1 hypothetical protein BCR36DRAFT_372303 [Piromyces finnis]